MHEPMAFHRRIARSLAFSALVALCPPWSLSAQGPVRCDSARLSDTRGDGTDTLRVMLRRATGSPRLDARYALEALDALRRHFILPSRLALPFRVPLDDSTSTMGLAASVDFTAHRDGSADQIRLSRSSYVPALDSAMIDAVRSASRESAFAPFDTSVTGATLPLVLDVAFGLEDTIRAGIDAALIRRARHGKLTLPQVIEPQRLPHFANARAAGSNLGFVDMAFAVSAEGRVLPGTVEFRRVTTSTLARAVLDVLPSWRFVPATISGCPVAALVSQSFSFTFPP
jgi:hypothetical protein